MTAEETEAMLHLASGGNQWNMNQNVYGELYGKGLVAGGELTEAGKSHLRAMADVLTNAPGKRIYTVLTSIVRNGRNMQAGEKFEACPAGTHVQRWLREGRIVER